MTARRLCKVFVSVGLLAYAAVILVPMVAFVVRVICDWGALADKLPVAPTEQGFFLSERQWALMLKTFALVTAAVIAALVLSLPAAYAVGRSVPPSLRPFVPSSLLFTLVVLPLLLSPMVLTFGWQSFWKPTDSNPWDSWAPYARCVWNWASWAWPIPAIIIGSGWSRIGTRAYESALLVSSPAAAFMAAVMPNLLRHVLVSALILGVVFLGEYTVPHAHGLIVIATEMLATSVSVSPAEALRLSWPLIVLLFLLMLFIRWFLSSSLHPRDDARPIDAVRSFRGATAVVVGMLVVTVGFPIVRLAWRSTLIAEMVEALATYHSELLGTLAVCLAVGIVISLIGVACAANDRWLIAGIATACLPALAPGALVGEAVLAAYQSIDCIYNYWPIVVIGLTARYTWIGLFAAWLAVRSESKDMIDSAALDVADFPTARIIVTMGGHWPVILCGGFIASAMAMADVAVVTIVQVPEPRMISTILIEKFHRFETPMLVAMSLWMVAAVAPGAILAAIVFGRRG
ncbi:MAG: hypothetical protein V3W34_14880 [Phycisphaerae bacterium]